MRTLKLILVLAFAAALLCSLTGCGWKFSLPFDRGQRYPNGDKYTAGDRSFSESVRKLDIDWSSGNLIIERHSGSALELQEEVSLGTTDKERVHSWLEGETLHIRFCAADVGSISFTKKNLRVLIPEDWKLDDLTVESTSAGVSVDEITADSLFVSSSSGSISVTSSASDLRLESTSGRIDLVQTGNSDSIRLYSTSGSVWADVEETKSLKAGSTSGSLHLTADAAKQVEAESTSGSLQVELTDTPTDVNLKATSGSIDLSLPKDAGFTAVVSTTSGSFNSNFAMVQNKDSYTCGSGEADITIRSTSGSVALNGY